MDYMTISEASIKWNLSSRRISKLCNEGRIPGAERTGYCWLLPKDATSAKKIAEMFPYANIPTNVIAAIQTAILSTQKSAEIRRLNDELSEKKVAEAPHRRNYIWLERICKGDADKILDLK